MIERKKDKVNRLSGNSEKALVGTRRIFPGWYLVAACWLMLFLTNAVAVGIFFKPILEEFGWDRTTLSLVHTVALTVFAFASPLLGKMIDRFGPRVMLFICVGTQTLSSVVNGLATSLWHLYAGRFLFELKGMHAGQVLINRWFVKKRGMAQGIVATGFPIGMLIATPLSQYLVLEWGWRTTLLFWAAVTFIILLPLAIIIKDNPQDIGLNPDGDPIQSKATTGASVSPGHTTMDGFAEDSDLRSLIQSRSFLFLSSTQLFCGIGCGFIMTHIVIFATDLGHTEMIGASFLSLIGAVNFIGVLLTGYLSDRITRSKTLAITHLIRSLAFFTLSASVFYGGGLLWQLYLAMAFFGFGFFTTAPLSSGLVADLYGYKHMGVLIGVILSCHMIGIAIGAYAGGLTFELSGSYFLFFPVQGVLEFAAAIFAFSIVQQKIKRTGGI
jgi:MFS family permease